MGVFGWFRGKKARESKPPPEMAPPPPAKPAAPYDGYWVFTKDHDREVPARDLRRELERGAPTFARHLVDTWQDLRASALGVPGFEARADAFRTRWREGHELGVRPLITILADHSGSLKGAASETLARTLIALGVVLEDLGVDFEVLGFTTRSWHGGESRKRWRNVFELPVYPGRLCDLLHIVYRDAVAPSPAWLNDLVLAASNEVLKENVDGEAILWAEERAVRFNPSKWVCLCVTDGAPVDDATIFANGASDSNWFLQRHLNDVVQRLDADEDTRIGCLMLVKPGEERFRTPFQIASISNLQPGEAQMAAFDLIEDLIWGEPPSEDALAEETPA